MIRIFTAIITCLLVATQAHAQTGLKGKVTDSKSGEPLAGVYVIIGNGAGTTTSTDGTYSYTTSPGKIQISFRFIGYRSIEKTVTVNQDEIITVDAALEPATMELDQIVVSAERSEQKLSETTVSLDVIKPDFISASHISDAQELINKTPGIEVLDGQASIRGGSGFSYGVGSRVLAMIDGLPLLSPDAGSIRWQYLPAEDISQVEIIKGAASVLYGSSALNGLINFRTADAGNIPVTRFYSENGFYCSPSNQDWKWWNTPRVFSNLSLSHLRRSGKTDFGAGIFLSTENSYRKFNDEKLGRLNIRLKHFSSVSGLKYGINITGALDEKTDFLLWENASTGALVQSQSSISHLHSRFITADPYLSFDRSGKMKHDLKMRLQASENIFPVKTQNNASSLSFYSEYQFTWKPVGFLNITSGLSSNWINIKSNFYGDHNGLNLAGFAQMDVEPLDRLKVIAGVRVEQSILDSHADKVVPVMRAGINWQAARATYLRASFGQGYRFPSVAEKYASTSLGSISIFPNPTIGAESGWSSEAGIRQGLMIGNIKGQADLAVFASASKDLIEYQFALYPGGMGFMAMNIEKAHIYGTETELTLTRESKNSRSVLLMGYTYVYPLGEEITGSEDSRYLKYRRKHSVKATITHTWKMVELTGSLYARSKILNIDKVFTGTTGEQILPGFNDYWADKNKGYVTCDISAGYSLSSKWKISLAVKNLTNTEYMGRPGDIQPVRNISLRISATI
ncbi:MAG: TonB-dependent receptor [Bacteroidales bacterium]